MFPSSIALARRSSVAVYLRLPNFLPTIAPFSIRLLASAGIHNSIVGGSQWGGVGGCPGRRWRILIIIFLTGLFAPLELTKQFAPVLLHMKRWRWAATADGCGCGGWRFCCYGLNRSIEIHRGWIDTDDGIPRWHARRRQRFALERQAYTC